jgi:hypothetical protein
LLTPWNGPEEPLPIPVEVHLWQRPRPSGDFFLAVPLPRGDVLLAAVDIAGPGTRSVPAAVYLQGWLRGWVRSLVSPPRIESLAGEWEMLRVPLLKCQLFAIRFRIS